MQFKSTPQLDLAFDFVQYTNQNIFLTGKAGTGKTTFLKNLRAKSPKRMVVVAPTGVAAINAGGVTIHSFFQISFGPQIPAEHRKPEKSDWSGKVISAGIKKFNKEKINIIKSLDLLVIDEISMVRADLLDAMDEVLRRYKDRNRPFGGVQLLMIGDLQQLAPIVKDDEWSVLRAFYENAFFFSSNALKKSGFVPIELRHIFRQSDGVFIEILNRVRENRLDANTIAKLNKRYIENFEPDDKEGYITLTTHNYQAQKINQQKLEQIKAGVTRFHADVEGDFPEYVYPTDESLELKVGAQVMFVKNDSSYDKLFYNGKIGKVIGIDGDVVEVQCPGDTDTILVEPAEWENAKYKLNESTQEIEEKVVGKFIQHPLKLAWAITIHKSQGLTFEKAIIDARQSFAHGQVYVALSRCKTLEGMVLRTPIEAYSVKNDSTVLSFTKYAEANQPDEKKLNESRRMFQIQLLSQLFDFKYLYNQIGYILRQLEEHQRQVVGTIIQNLQIMQLPVQNELVVVGEKFARQLEHLMMESFDAENNQVVQERLIKASDYFLQRLKEKVEGPFNGSSFETDNKSIKKVITEATNKMAKEIEVKKICLEEIANGFNHKRFIEVKSKAAIEKEKASKRKRVSLSSMEGIKYPNFYNELRSWRSDKSVQLNVTDARIFGQRTLIDIANNLPVSRDELKAIKGMGGTKLRDFGKEVLSMVFAFRKMEGLSIPFGAENEIELASLTTQQVSLKMFKDGQAVSQIAKARNLASSTIESHLAQFVDSGEIELDQLVDSSKIDAIKRAVLSNPKASTSEIRAKLGPEYSYGEIRIVTSLSR